jgi:polyhydroxybutyrate depolymerase
VPAGRDRRTPAPLVLFFHGYGAPGGEEHAHGLDVDALADEAGFVLVTPDGTPDSNGRRFWNATDACCDFDGKRPDDVGYVRWILDDVASKMPIDPARVYVAGHSNGGFFSHRLACELAPRIAAAVSLAGAQWSDPSRCHASEPVSVLEIHGDADDIVRYGGGRIFDLPARIYPGALETTADWARLDGCGDRPEPVGARFDFDADVAGADTTRLSYPGCRAGVSVELWTEAGGGHLPHPTREGLRAVWAWMLAHAKGGAPSR